ncbi:MAG: hypothetical protein RL549_386 [Verrucomicrobiota bacterium]
MDTQSDAFPKRVNSGLVNRWNFDLISLSVQNKHLQGKIHQIKGELTK